MRMRMNIWPSRFGLLGRNASVTPRVISRFGLLGLNASVTPRVIKVWFVRA